MIEPVGDDWLFYLVQPTRLLSDCDTFSNTRKVTLLKQFLSQAEITDRRSNAANSDNLILDTLHADFDPQLDSANPDTFQPYKKSKILDIMSLQLAADMKFNLNLFGITTAMPVKLLIRLCRTLVTNTARHSTALKHLFELAADRDSMFLVDPYSTYAWISLHPTTVYAIMCYHIMCFQVSLAGSLLPRPFRSFTPAVSGLTEIPASTFFPDMPVDIGGILTRILESVNQLLDIYNLLDNINIARPLASAFCPFESADPPVLEPQSDGVPEPKDNDPSRLYNAQLLTKEYVSATINFTIGRYDFQQHQFERAKERLELALELMNSKQIDYLEECGATLKLVSSYITACRSYDLAQKPCLPLKEFTEPGLFVESFCHSLENLVNASPNNSTTLFWLEHCHCDPQLRTLETSNEESNSLVTIEDFLCKALMDDICSLVLKSSNSTNNLPLGYGLRHWLENLCFQLFVQSTMKSTNSASGNQSHNSPNKPHRQSKANSESMVTIIEASSKLFTKVHIYNALERLMSNSFELPLQLVTEILTGQLNPLDFNGTETEVSTILSWDSSFARQFLLQCLHHFLIMIQSATNELGSPDFKRLVPQFIMFMVQEGISLIEESSTIVRKDSENMGLIKEFHFLMNSLHAHKLVEYLPRNCVDLIKATLSKYKPDSKPTHINFALLSLPDPSCDIEKPTDKSQCADVGSRTELHFTPDIDMKNPDAPTTSTGDLDMSSYSQVTHHQASSLTGFRGPNMAGSMFHLDSSSLVPNANLVRRLLCSLEPGEINFCIDNLLRAGMSCDTVLGLNSAWIPTLRYLISLGGPRLNPPMEVSMQDPLECSLSFTNNVPSLVSILVQLAKASLITRHQTTALWHARTLLLTSLSALNPDVSSTNPSRLVQCALWIRAALRHELLLTDLLEFLDPLTTDEFVPTLPNLDPQRHKPPKKNQHSLGFGTGSEVKLNSLSNRAKICIFHALGLPDNAKDLECVADLNNPVCLSNELLSASACFLLSIGEQPFLTSVFTINKHGTTSQRRSYFGTLELVRILLWLDELLSMHSGYLKRNSETVTDSASQVTDSKIAQSHPNPGWAHQQQVPSKSGDKNPYLDRLKSTMEELHNFMVYGCLAAETNQRKQVGSHDCQLNVSELCTIIQYLACITEPLNINHRSRNTTKTPSEPKRKSSAAEPIQSHRTTNGLELLNYILVCLAHLLHTVNPSVSLSNWKALNEFTRPANAPGQITLHSDSCSAPNETTMPKPKVTGPNNSALKQTEYDFAVDNAVLLNSDMWPTELNANTQLPSNLLCELLQFVLTCLLTVQPHRIDLLALRSEIEFYRKDYRAVLSTYSELGAIVSDSFTCDIPSTIYSTEIVSRMIQCCKSLGMIHEAIILCQFNSDPDLIETGVQMIIAQLENLAPVGPTNLNAKNGSNNAQPVLAESFTSACGGLLTQSVFDCPDDLLNYLWEIRLIETLATSSARRGALSQLTKFREIMDTLHSYLHPVFGCDNTPPNKCICQDLLMEQLTFFIQTSDVTNELLQTAHSCFSSESVVDKDSVYAILNENSILLDWLNRILQIFAKLNEELLTYIEALTDGNAKKLLHLPAVLTAVRMTVLSVLSAYNLHHLLKPILFAYLSLELEFAEVECDEINVFSSVIPTNYGDFKSHLIHLARSLTSSKNLLNLSYFYRSTVIGFIRESLTHRIKLLCSENYSEHFLNPIIEYKNCVLKLHLVPQLFCRSDESRSIIEQLNDDMIYKLFYSVRKSDLFSLIIEYPDSMAALLDLGQCLNHLPVRQDLITHLTEEVKQRLLHPGVHTEQILVAYSYLVRALRLVDSSFLVQDIVCRPVSVCLRQREDAVRCIVDKLISAPEQDGTDEDLKTDEYVDSTTELHQELLLPKPLEVEPLDGAEDSDADLVAEDPPFDLESEPTAYHQDNTTNGPIAWGSDWQPDPIEALYQKGLWRRRLDLLSMLVSIYGSKKAFLVEYKQLLSQRLLRQRNFHTARELRNLELLKLRFGGQNLHECEVMLKDIRDSKRIATLVCNGNSTESQDPKVDGLLQPHEPSLVSMETENSKQRDKKTLDEDSNTDQKLFPLSAYILSIHYWPELIDDRFKLPEGLRPTFNNYERCFQRLKGNRTLNWMHKLGLVNIELGLGDQSIQLDVTPLQASIAYLFTLKRIWPLRDLVQELEISASHIRNSLHLFVQMGYLKHSDTHMVSSTGELLPRKDRPDLGTEVYEVCDRVESNDVESGTKSSSAHQSGSAQGDPSAVPGSSTSWIYSSHEDAFDPASAIATVRDRKEKELQVFWSYIVAMLTNLGGLSLDRIHSMLRMFALGSTSSLDCNRDELRQFLDRKIREAQLVYNGDVYKLVSSDN